MAHPGAVFFDAYGTLFDVRSVTAAGAAATPRPDAFVANWRRRQLEYSWLRTLLGSYVDFEQVSADALDATAAAEGVLLAATTRRELLAAWLHLAAFPDVAPTLDRLAREPALRDRLGILSNGSPTMLATVLAHNGLTDRFAWVLSVDAVHRYKPTRAVYDLVVEATGLSREQILFVSSNYWDAAGATAFGFPTCWVNRSGASPERLGVEPTRVVRTLTELLTPIG